MISASLFVQPQGVICARVTGNSSTDEAKMTGMTPGHVHAQRQIGALPAVDLSPDHPLGVLHRDASLALGDEDDSRPRPAGR